MKHLVLLVLFLSGCNYAVHHDPPITGEGGQEVPCDENTSGPVNNVTYEQVKIEVFQSKCIGCHSSGSASGGVNLSSYSTAKPWAAQIKSTVVNNIMPKAPRPPLSEQEKDLVVTWVDSGALNGGETQTCNTNDGGGNEIPLPNEPLTEVPPDTELTYALVREKIFKLRCFSCHSTAGGNASGLNLETYFNTFDEIDDIYEEVSEQSMPPAPRPPLNDIERTTLLKWIELGSPQ